jgi:hypothetical protein
MLVFLAVKAVERDVLSLLGDDNWNRLALPLLQFLPARLIQVLPTSNDMLWLAEIWDLCLRC